MSVRPGVAWRTAKSNFLSRTKDPTQIEGTVTNWWRSLFGQSSVMILAWLAARSQPNAQQVRRAFLPSKLKESNEVSANTSPDRSVTFSQRERGVRTGHKEGVFHALH